MWQIIIRNPNEEIVAVLAVNGTDSEAFKTKR